MDELTPKAAEDLLRQVFPAAQPHRTHTKDGWTDIVEIGLVQLWVRVYNKKTRVGLHKVEPGTAVVSIRGVRRVVDGSVTPLWQADAREPGGLQGALEAAKAQLLGLAAGFLAVSGESGVAGVSPTLGPPSKAEKPEVDLDGIFDDIGDLVR